MPPAIRMTIQNAAPEQPTRTVTPIFESIESAARKLDVLPSALRSRCRRAAKQAADMATIPLGGGIVAIKFGRSWRIRIPTE